MFFTLRRQWYIFFAIPIVSKCALLENSFDAPKNLNSRKNDIWGLEKRCRHVVEALTLAPKEHFYLLWSHQHVFLANYPVLSGNQNDNIFTVVFVHEVWWRKWRTHQHLCTQETLVPVSKTDQNGAMCTGWRLLQVTKSVSFMCCGIQKRDENERKVPKTLIRTSSNCTDIP